MALSIAIPKGRLLNEVLRLLRSIGWEFVYEERNYNLRILNFQHSAMIVKPRSIPQNIALGNFDLGFCGLDLVAEANYEDCLPIFDLGLSSIEIVVAVAAESKDILINPPKRPVVIATEYVNLADDWAMRHNLAHVTIHSWGSTEGYAPKLADIVFDCRETGKTLEANGLLVIDKVMTSSTHVVANKLTMEKQTTEIHEFIEKIREVM